MDSNMSDISERTEFYSDDEQAPQSIAAPSGSIPAIPGENLKGETLLGLASTRSNAELAAEFPTSSGTPLKVSVIRYRINYALNSRTKRTGQDYESVKVEHNQLRVASGVKYLRAGRSKQGGNRYKAPIKAAAAPATHGHGDGDVDMDDENISDDDYQGAGHRVNKHDDDNDDESVIDADGEAIAAAKTLMSLRDAVMEDDETEVADEKKQNTKVLIDQQTIDAANTLLGLVRGVRM